jgi:WhiB family redox-sensing transcriptional regulator
MNSSKSINRENAARAKAAKQIVEQLAGTVRVGETLGNRRNALRGREDLQRELDKLQAQGQCRQSGAEAFWREETTPAEARALCAGCPVAQACLKYAVAVPEADGVWGGVDAKTRKSVVRELRRRQRDTAAATSDERLAS